MGIFWKIGLAVAVWVGLGVLAATAQDLEPTEQEVVLVLHLQHMDGRPRSQELIELRPESGPSVVRTADDAGIIRVLLPKGRTYNPYFLAYARWEWTETTIATTDKAGLYEQEVRLKFDYELSPGAKFELKNTLFESGSAALKPDYTGELALLADFLKAHTKIRLLIEGHTDNVGKPEANLKLSQARADAVRQFLVGKGVAATRLETKGWGDTRPVDTNDTPEGKSKNRRTEISELK